MNSKRGFDRRDFLMGAATATGALLTGTTAKPANAIEPIKRPYGSKMKLSIAAYSYRKYLQTEKSMDIMGFLEECAKLGLGAAEPTSYYFPDPMPEGYLLAFKQKAHILGLDISGTAVGNTFTHAKGEKRDEQLEYVNRWVDYSAIMGAPCIRIFAGSVQSDQSFEEAMENCIETTKIACDYAATKGVFLALENHGGIVSKPEDMLKIINAVDSPWFGVNFDSGNFRGEDPYAQLEMIAPYTVNAQVKVDIHPQGQDKQPTDFERVLKILSDADYRGYVALEYEASEEPKEAIPRFIKELQELL